MSAELVAPRDAAQAAEVLRSASAERRRTRIIGGATWIAASPEPPSVLITSRELAGVDEYVPTDLAITVGAGITHAALAKVLDAHGQHLPLDPPFASDATVGATIATASAGPLRLGYGTPRDHVLGLDLVTGDGRLLRLGGKVMKNVAGYDLVRLVVGSRGRLGLISRLHLRLRARPMSDVTLAVVANDKAAPLAFAMQLRAQRIDPVAVELVSPAWARAIAPELGSRWALLVRLHGSPETTSGLRARIEATVDPRALELMAIDGDRAWRTFAAYETAAVEVMRLADRPSMLGRTLDVATSLSTSANVSLAAHVADGIVRVIIPPAVEREDRATAGRRLLAARTELEARGGSVIVHEPALAAQLVEKSIVGDKTRALIAMFDPASILSTSTVGVSHG